MQSQCQPQFLANRIFVQGGWIALARLLIRFELKGRLIDIQTDSLQLPIGHFDVLPSAQG
ncbi:hypothetical protein D3C76_1858400 [compost metagenome]